MVAKRKMPASQSSKGNTISTPLRVVAHPRWIRDNGGEMFSRPGMRSGKRSRGSPGSRCRRRIGAQWAPRATRTRTNPVALHSQRRRPTRLRAAEEQPDGWVTGVGARNRADDPRAQSSPRDPEEGNGYYGRTGVLRGWIDGLSIGPDSRDEPYSVRTIIPEVRGSGGQRPLVRRRETRSQEEAGKKCPARVGRVAKRWVSLRNYKNNTQSLMERSPNFSPQLPPFPLTESCANGNGAGPRRCCVGKTSLCSAAQNLNRLIISALLLGPIGVFEPRAACALMEPEIGCAATWIDGEWQAEWLNPPEDGRIWQNFTAPQSAAAGHENLQQKVEDEEPLALAPGSIINGELISVNWSVSIMKKLSQMNCWGDCGRRVEH
ncbi:hypothetical protein C8R44DRAFT_725418 [Mycena epipterygia]|nr:hypothetical protein C8R44DRAFT_725418 [Mycena epipterygia]